jgi:hypothetical protein
MEYEVFINCESVGIFESEEGAWEEIGSHSFGALYEVRDPETGEVIPEFIPL